MFRITKLMSWGPGVDTVFGVGPTMTTVSRTPLSLVHHAWAFRKSPNQRGRESQHLSLYLRKYTTTKLFNSSSQINPTRPPSTRDCQCRMVFTLLWLRLLPDRPSCQACPSPASQRSPENQSESTIKKSQKRPPRSLIMQNNRTSPTRPINNFLS